MELDWYSGKRCVVTGGASFIGSHLVEELVRLGSHVTVVDDFSSGRIEHLNSVNESNLVSIVRADLSSREETMEAIPSCDVLFHLAAIHGGRGFIEAFPDAMLVNLVIDNNVYFAATESGTSMIVQASSACTYPVNLQSETSSRLELEEDSVGFSDPAGSFPDGTYGWMKLMGEYQLEVSATAGQFRGRSARLFTAYGPRENESHAVIALIAKAKLRIDPFPIWGSGLQTRNFTYVSDTVLGLLHLGADQRDIDFDAFNVGTKTHHTILDLLDVIFEVENWKPSGILRLLDKPMGVASRAASNRKFQAVFNWEPTFSLQDGIQLTSKWYTALESKPQSAAELELLLQAR